VGCAGRQQRAARARPAPRGGRCGGRWSQPAPRHLFPSRRGDGRRRRRPGCADRGPRSRSMARQSSTPAGLSVDAFALGAGVPPPKVTPLRAVNLVLRRAITRDVAVGVRSGGRYPLRRALARPQHPRYGVRAGHDAGAGPGRRVPGRGGAAFSWAGLEAADVALVHQGHRAGSREGPRPPDAIAPHRSRSRGRGARPPDRGGREVHHRARGGGASGGRDRATAGASARAQPHVRHAPPRGSPPRRSAAGPRAHGGAEGDGAVPGRRRPAAARPRQRGGAVGGRRRRRGLGHGSRVRVGPGPHRDGTHGPWRTSTPSGAWDRGRCETCSC
jgi:hypothetical protein